MLRPRVILRALLMAAFLASLPAVAWCEDEAGAATITTADATRFVGQTVTICGPVAGTGYFPHLKGEPTFINFDRRYPEQSFTVVIWGKVRAEFEEAPDRLYTGQELCVTGKIETYKGKPQIVVANPEQIEIIDAGLVAERFSYEERVLLKAMLAALGYSVDEGSGEWDGTVDEAMREFQQSKGIEGAGEQSPQTLRALAQAVETIPAEGQQRILRLLLLNLAQREEATPRK